MSGFEEAEQQIVFCGGCGHKNIPPANFCETCGEKLVYNEPLQDSFNSPPASNGNIFKNIPKKVMLIITGTIALVVAVASFFIIGSITANPSGIAKGYFKAVCSGEYEEAFKYLSLDSTDFINKESFAKYMQESGPGIIDLVNFSVKENKLTNLEKEQLELGLLDDKDGFTKTYTINYAVKGVSSQNSQTITLVKSNKRKLLFFPDYSVSINNLLVSDYTVSVPKGSTVSIDGITLLEMKNTEEAEKSSMDTYIVLKIFSGSHDLSVKNNIYEDYIKTITVGSSSSNSTSVTKMTVKENIRKDLANKTEEDYKKILTGAIDGKSFDSLELSCTNNSEALEKIKNEYDNLVKLIKTDSEGVGYKSVTFKSSSEISNQSNINTSTYSCSLSIKYDYAKMIKSTEKEDDLEEKTYKNKSQSIQFTYVYENDVWVLQTINKIGSSY